MNTSLDEHIVFYKLSANDSIISVEKAVALKQDLTATVSSRGKLVPSSFYQGEGTSD